MCDVSATICKIDSKIRCYPPEACWKLALSGTPVHCVSSVVPDSGFCNLARGSTRGCVWWLFKTPPALVLITRLQLCTLPVQLLFCLPSFLCSTWTGAAEIMTLSLPCACLPGHLSWPDRATRHSPRADVGPIWTLFKGNLKESCMPVHIWVTVICLGPGTLHTGLGTLFLFCFLFVFCFCLCFSFFLRFSWIDKLPRVSAAVILGPYNSSLQFSHGDWPLCRTPLLRLPQTLISLPPTTIAPPCAFPQQPNVELSFMGF